MKPLNLILENIGPFRHEEIDFTRLGEIFLIFGSTGAGKSTTFDAITYMALRTEVNNNYNVGANTEALFNTILCVNLA